VAIVEPCQQAHTGPSLAWPCFWVKKTHGLQTLSNEVINLLQIVHKSKRQSFLLQVTMKWKLNSRVVHDYWKKCQ